jgi:hypothetical protein
VFLEITTSTILHSTSTHKLNGVTSRSKISLTSHCKIHHCIPAHKATASSGFTVVLGSLPNISLTIFFTNGILVDPQTKITSFISDGESSTSFNADKTGCLVLSTNGFIIFSNSALVSISCTCLGVQSGLVIINGILIST